MDASQKSNKGSHAPLPPIRELLISSPLYATFELLPERDEEQIRELAQGGFQLDCYCVKCDKETPFRRVFRGTQTFNDVPIRDRMFPVLLACQRDGDHAYWFYFQIEGQVLSKIGQTPSLESIAYSDVQKYRKVAGPQNFSELHRAGGLASAGVGIGAFVYLRRIFERLIEHHRQVVEADSGQLDGFSGFSVEQKILALKDVLPPLLVEHRKVYGILSKGIHELSEDFCSSHFAMVRLAIIQILEQDFKAKSEKDAADALRNELERIERAAKDSL